MVQLILYSASLSNNIVQDNNGSIAGRKRAFINPTLCFKQCHFHTGKDGAKKVTNWSACQLASQLVHMNFPNCRLKLQHYVVPALVETALNMGNAGVTAVTQIHRSLTLKPAIIINIIIIATLLSQWLSRLSQWLSKHLMTITTKGSKASSRRVSGSHPSRCHRASCARLLCCWKVCRKWKWKSRSMN